MRLTSSCGLVLLGLLAGLFISPSPIAKEKFVTKSWTPTKYLIENVETELVMPAGTALPSYARYYYGQYVHGRRMLIGEFVLNSDEPGVHITEPEKVPKILDGGCTLIDLEYDVEKKAVVNLSCNGVG